MRRLVHIALIFAAGVALGVGVHRAVAQTSVTVTSITFDYANQRIAVTGTRGGGPHTVTCDLVANQCDLDGSAVRSITPAKAQRLRDITPSGRAVGQVVLDVYQADPAQE